MQLIPDFPDFRRRDPDPHTHIIAGPECTANQFRPIIDVDDMQQAPAVLLHDSLERRQRIEELYFQLCFLPDLPSDAIFNGLAELQAELQT